MALTNVIRLSIVTYIRDSLFDPELLVQTLTTTSKRIDTRSLDYNAGGGPTLSLTVCALSRARLDQ